MANKLLFDTLQYATLLTDGGIEKGDIHSRSLSMILDENIYDKWEVNNMFEEALRRVDESLRRVDENRDRSEARLEEERLKLENRIEKSFNRMTILLGAWITAAAAFVTVFITVLHYFIR